MTVSAAPNARSYHVLLAHDLPFDHAAALQAGPGDEQFNDLITAPFLYDTGAVMVLVGTEDAANKLVPGWKTRTEGLITRVISGVPANSPAIVIPDVDFYVYPNPTEEAWRFLNGTNNFDVEYAGKQYLYNPRNSYKKTTRVYVSVQYPRTRTVSPAKSDQQPTFLVSTR